MTASSDEPRPLVRCALAAIVILVPAVLTAMYRPPVDLGLDGSQYLQIANHIARGHGLVTSMSFYHQALHPLPQPSSIYPAWPLALGAAIRAFGLEHAARFLPKALYLVDAVLAYRLLDLGWRRLRPTRVAPFGAAHLGALLFALNPIFFWSTSLPYSEGLAFLWMLLVLGALDSAANSTHEVAALRAAALAGLLSGFLYLTRFQAVLVPLAVSATLLLTADAKSGVRRASLALGAAALPFAAEASFLLRLPHAKPSMLFDFSSYRQVPEVPVFDFYVRQRLLVDWVTDRVGGLFVAFDPADANSYNASHGALAYAPIVVLMALASTPATAVSRVALAARAAELALPVGSILVGIALVLPVHVAHEKHFWPWLFGYRHGLPYVLIALPSLMALLGSRRLLFRASGILLGLIATYQGGRGVVRYIQSKPASASALTESADFLARHPGSTAVAVEPQSLSVHTDSGLYWVACWSPPDFLPKMFEHVPVDFALLRPHETSCDAFSAIKGRLTLVEGLAGGEMLAYRLR